MEYISDYLEQTYIPRYQSVRGEDTVKIYRVVLHKLWEYEDFAGYRVRFDAITIDFYNRDYKIGELYRENAHYLLMPP